MDLPIPGSAALETSRSEIQIRGYISLPDGVLPGSVVWNLDDGKATPVEIVGEGRFKLAVMNLPPGRSRIVIRVTGSNRLEYEGLVGVNRVDPTVPAVPPDAGSQGQNDSGAKPIEPGQDNGSGDGGEPKLPKQPGPGEGEDSGTGAEPPTARAGLVALFSEATVEEGSLRFSVPFSVVGVGDPAGILVSFKVIGGTATAGADFNLESGIVRLGPGETQATARFDILDDYDSRILGEVFFSEQSRRPGWWFGMTTTRPPS